jgi:hypothetical protein
MNNDSHKMTPVVVSFCESGETQSLREAPVSGRVVAGLSLWGDIRSRQKRGLGDEVLRAMKAGCP